MNFAHSVIDPEIPGTSTSIGISTLAGQALLVPKEFISAGVDWENRIADSDISGLSRFFNEGLKMSNWVTNLWSLTDFSRISQVLALPCTLSSDAKKCRVTLKKGCLFCVSIISYESHRMEHLKNVTVSQYFVPGTMIDERLAIFHENEEIIGSN